MAETIGLVASVLQLASTGLKLSQTLYQYADGVATADRRIKGIAKEIQLTSYVIEELGVVFKQDGTASLISKNALKAADETMKECSSVFAEIDATLQKSKKKTIGRLMLPFRDKKIELLRTHIDTLKSTLQLLMQVLTHAHQVASKMLDQEAVVKQREQIKEMLELKKRSDERYEQSLRDYSMSEGSTVLDLEDLDKESGDPSSADHLTVATLALGSTISNESLGICVQHIRNLLDDIEALQQALTIQVNGDDHSGYHQSVVGSYFRARGYFDSILLGNPHTVQGNLPDSTAQGRLSRSNISVDKKLAQLNERAETKVTELENSTRKRVQSVLEPDRPDDKQHPPIKLQDTMGRKYVLPFHLHKTWKDIHNLIIQIYIDVDEWSRHAVEGSFDLINADGEIMMPAYWNFVICPGSFVIMKFWPSCNQLRSHNAPRVSDMNLDQDLENDLQLHLGQEVKPEPEEQICQLEADTMPQVQDDIDANLATLSDTRKAARVDNSTYERSQSRPIEQGFHYFAQRQPSPGLFANGLDWFGAPSNIATSDFTNNGASTFGLDSEFGSRPEARRLPPPPPRFSHDAFPVPVTSSAAWIPSGDSFGLGSPVPNLHYPTKEKITRSDEAKTSAIVGADDEVDELLKEWTTVFG